MPDTDNTQDRELTTEQIATAGSGTGRENVTAPTGRQGFDDADPGLRRYRSFFERLLAA